MLKLRLLLIIFVQLPLAYGRGDMPTRMMQNLLKKSEVQHKCHDLDMDADQTHLQSHHKVVNTDFFEATIDCEFTCGNNKIQGRAINAEFRPLSFGLYEGDGSSNQKIMWRSLGSTIDLWSKNQCLNAAKQECADFKNFKVNSITSGDWLYRGDYNCQRKDVVYSPFDEQFNLKNAGLPTYKLNPSPIFSGQALTTPPTKNSRSISEAKASSYILEPNQGKCTKRAKAYTCFGDCVYESKTKAWNETLITPEYLGDYAVDLCLDDFLQEFAKVSSKSEKEFLCQKISWEIFQSAKSMGTSCASFRFDLSCPF
jgi:hypothetical protein